MIILTPIVYATVIALQIDPLPYLNACTFAANTGSLVFPMSNLTNLLVVDRLELPSWRFTAAMVIPKIVAVAANAAVFLWLFRDRLPRRPPIGAYISVAPVGAQARFFRISVAGFGLVRAEIMIPLADAKHIVRSSPTSGGNHAVLDAVWKPSLVSAVVIFLLILVGASGRIRQNDRDGPVYVRGFYPGCSPTSIDGLKTQHPGRTRLGVLKPLSSPKDLT